MVKKTSTIITSTPRTSNKKYRYDPGRHCTMPIKVTSPPERRDALRRIGKYPAYAVPALLALISKPAAASPI